ncbi:unnamed protein product, partial [Symbiodinium sp. KB8]
MLGGYEVVGITKLFWRRVRAGEASTWEDGIFHRLDVEEIFTNLKAPPEGDLEPVPGKRRVTVGGPRLSSQTARLLVSGRFHDRVSVQEVCEKAPESRSTLGPKSFDGSFVLRYFNTSSFTCYVPCLTAAHWRRRFEETQKELRAQDTVKGVRPWISIVEPLVCIQHAPDALMDLGAHDLEAQEPAYLPQEFFVDFGWAEERQARRGTNEPPPCFRNELGAALEEAALRLQLAKVQGTVEALRKALGR